VKSNKRIVTPTLDKFEKEQLDQAKFFKDLGLRNIFEKLDTRFRENCERDTMNDFEECQKFQKLHNMCGGEIFYLPDCRWYREVFDLVPKNSIVLDAGAGDLRFSLALATKAKRVYAVEINPKIIGEALQIISYGLPKNVIPICRDVFDMPLPRDVNTIVCIMIHRQHDFPKSWSNNKRIRIIHAEHNGVRNRHKVGKDILYKILNPRICIKNKVKGRANNLAHREICSKVYQATDKVKEYIQGRLY
jgi:SAM-dependent methyltransferase